MANWIGKIDPILWKPSSYRQCTHIGMYGMLDEISLTTYDTVECRRFHIIHSTRISGTSKMTNSG